VSGAADNDCQLLATDGSSCYNMIQQHLCLFTASTLLLLLQPFVTGNVPASFGEC